MITEDIDVSWKIQTSGYDIFYEPRALCWVLVPETIKGLFNQRLRWAQGGAETMMKYFPKIWHLKNRRLWPMFAEYIITAIWAISLVSAMIASVYQFAADGNVSFINWASLKPSMAILFIAFFAQLSISLYIDNRYERGVVKYAFSCIWYPW
ncbi:N-glycosyltransferase [Actinobacillus ureae]|uniref:Glycosyltransferase 2-like domain-containing protein n=1 Tax=Actinobacillus ureae ATCC 25976 TaxID=887324 RepID=E8KFK9_9PAST|nr:hypothetical protein HMPREF0027_0626 [Actinobacillus ureae ATCC 25976]SUT85624.1 N-glycosyltransferase [Actinobacillus ureae]SUU43150.1 N-glycosyltransferase [Actinobacillus ureae]